LFGLVLAVGIVVDDAIVVVENVERNMREGMSPKEAAHRTMDEVGGALISIALTLCAVFVLLHSGAWVAIIVPILVSFLYDVLKFIFTG
jgi:multidrug efflux pump subunit AcrB